MIKHSAFVDTNFLISLVKSGDIFHNNANEYFEALLRDRIDIYTSTISIAEYCVKHEVSSLPLKHIKTMFFDLKSAKLSGKMINYMSIHRNQFKNLARYVVPNDIKLLAHAESLNIDCFVSGDNNLYKMYQLLKQQDYIFYHYFDLCVSCATNMNLLPNTPLQGFDINTYFKSYPIKRKKQ